jgi:hypothetical protein
MRRAWRFYWGHRRALFLTWLAAAALFTWMNASAWNAYHAAEEESTRGQWGRVMDPLQGCGSSIRVDTGWSHLFAGLQSHRTMEMWMNPLEPHARYFMTVEEWGYV